MTIVELWLGSILVYRIIDSFFTSTFIWLPNISSLFLWLLIFTQNTNLIGHHRVHTRAFSLINIWTTDLYVDDYNYPLNLFWLVFSFPFTICQKIQKKRVMLDCRLVGLASWKVGTNPLPCFPNVCIFLKQKCFSYYVKVWSWNLKSREKMNGNEDV